MAAAYAPTWDEVILANTCTIGLRTRVCFLIQLRTYQRLGYAVQLADVPTPIVGHIAQSVGVPAAPLSIAGYGLFALSCYPQKHRPCASARRPVFLEDVALPRLSAVEQILWHEERNDPVGNVHHLADLQIPCHGAQYVGLQGRQVARAA